ncbi:MAG: efflux RND transporter periplasmic adaptor subunit [bacterium]|nr:efflux RND transporter periplasmic adaptor subunit [bacterium]
MKKMIVITILLAVAALVGWRVTASNGHAPAQYRFVEITRGDLAAVVAATGTLEPVTTVQVGTQVSGIIENVLVDYNDPVTAGQIVANIDTTLLAAAVASSRAQVERAEADLRQAEREYRRLDALHAEKLISESEHYTALYNLDLARAGLKSARVDLERTEINLDYATIDSPIDGIVVQRSVDPGQTVQSSFSAPELFLIAGDLTAMQILVSVDESDIGQIAEGQDVSFTVQAYPDDLFAGTVRQVRLQSVTTENVVNYVAVVDVANPDGRLLPGMTATVDFVVDQATDIFYVQNAALRYRPDQEVMMAVMERKRAARQSRGGTARPDSARASEGAGAGARPGGGQGGGIAAMASGGLPDGMGMLWTVDESGEIDLIMVRTGISDGTNTQVRGRNLEAGTQIIAGVSRSTTATTSSPFQQNQSAGSPPRPGGF